MSTPSTVRLRARGGRRLHASAALGLALVIGVNAEAATRRVPSQYATIQAAVDASTAGDIVLISPGTYRGVGNTNIVIPSDLPAITIRSENGPSTCVIDCEHAARGLRLAGSGAAVVEGLTVRNGQAVSGGGIHGGTGVLSLVTCVIESCAALGGDADDAGDGGALVSYGPALVRDCVFLANHAARHGGAVLARHATLIACHLEGNTALAGGAVFSDAESGACIAMLHVTLKGNSAILGGGGCGPASVANCRFLANAAAVAGGAWHIQEAAGEPRFLDSRCSLYEGNSAGWYGGAMSAYHSYVNSANDLLLENASGLDGGGLCAADQGGAGLWNCILLQNTAQHGAAIAAEFQAGVSVDRTCIFPASNAAATVLKASGAPPDADERQALIRFDDIFGSAPGQIPPGAIVSSATLRLNVLDPITCPAAVHRMQRPWGATDTWNTFGEPPWNTSPGVQADDTEAAAEPDDVPPAMPAGPRTIDVTSSLRTWALDQAANFGWVLSVTAPDVLAFDSSEAAAVSDRPKLTVVYTRPEPEVTPLDPPDGAAGIPARPVLSASVTDPHGHALDVSFFGREVGATQPPDFTLVHVTDTQYYTQSSPQGYGTMMAWVNSQQAARNIAHVIHTGDITDFGNSEEQWIRADLAMDLLEAPLLDLPHGVPYGILPGNHDGAPGNTLLYNQYFGVSRFFGRPYYGGHYGSNNDSNFTLFSAAGMDFISIHLRMQPDSAILAWADGLLQAYSDRRAIVSSHYIIEVGENAPFSPWGLAIYNALKHNPNLFLMLCGHVYGEGKRFDDYQGRRIWTMVADYQSVDGGVGGWLRLLRFSPAHDKIYVRTYSPVSGAYMSGPSSQFELDYEMSGAGPFEPITSLSGVASGSIVTLPWPGRMPGRTYEWYVAASDGATTASSPVWSFTSTGACTTGDDCDDGLFCNGVETCQAGGGTCVPGANPCPPGTMCDDEADICIDPTRADVDASPASIVPSPRPLPAAHRPRPARLAFDAAARSRRAIPRTATFQQGVNTYSGAVDTYIEAGAGTSNAVFTDAGGYVLWGDNVLFVDPLLRDSAAGDYRLALDSPCVDAGDAGYLWGDPLDIDGDGVTEEPHPRDLLGMSRLRRDAVDIGPFETQHGDLNCDGRVDFFDIDALVAALNGPAAYHAAYPGCEWLLGDCDASGGVNFFDIDPFIREIGR